MSKKDIKKIQEEACVHCGYGPAKHELGNFADGPMIGRQFLVCPFAIYKPLKERQETGK